MSRNDKPDMPPSLVAEVEALMKTAGEARRAGPGRESLAFSEEAWSLIPEPKSAWNVHPQTIARGVVETIVERQGCDVLDLRIDRRYLTCFDPGRRHTFTNMVAGHALFQCGRQTEAFAAFKPVLQEGGPGFFTGPSLDLAEKG
jgi:hypothetical protein